MDPSVESKATGETTKNPGGSDDGWCGPCSGEAAEPINFGDPSGRF